MFSVKMISEEGHKYIFISYADNIDQARKDALIKIFNKGWSQFNYKIVSITTIIKPEVSDGSLL